MPAPFPIFKLAFIFVKQVHKPASTWIRERAKQSNFFRTRVCMPPAQFYHWCEVKMKMWVMNLGRPVEIPKLNEAMAIELGANLLGEGIIFSIAAGILYAEYVRQSNKELAKEQARLDAMQDMRDLIRDLEMETQRQDAQIRELSRVVYTVQEKTTKLQQVAESPVPSDGTKPSLKTLQTATETQRAKN